MRRWLAVVYLFLIAFTARGDVLRGAWHVSSDDRRLHLDLTREQSHMSHSIDWNAFRGLSTTDINATSETPVHFQLVREAGTFDFTGSFLNGDGVGRFAFTPEPAYAARLRSLGVGAEDITDERLYSLAALDVSTSFIREMQSLGYHESLDRYVAFRIHGATPDFVREMQSLGYTDLSSDKLVAFRIHGVTPVYIRDLRAAGYNDLSPDRLVAFRIHGVTPEFARDLRGLGVTGLDPDQLVAMRIHGVTTEFVRDLGQLGYKNLSSDELVSMRIHGVTTQFIRELEEAGYHGVPVEKLVALKIHGVDSDFVRKVK